MSEANKAVVRRFINEYQTAGRIEVARELLADDFVDHSALPGFSPDKRGVINVIEMLRCAFGGLHVEIHDQVADDEKVVTRKTFRGTHTGEFFGVPPTGRPIEFGVIDILAVAGGQLKEHWCQVDFAGLMGQITSEPGAVATG